MNTFRVGDRVQAKSDLPAEFGRVRGVVVASLGEAITVDLTPHAMYSVRAEDWELDETFYSSKSN